MSELAAWVEATFGHVACDEALWVRALTHGSREGEVSYERLEFLGDRVLGLSMAQWLFELFPEEPEGKLTSRFNTLVSGAMCAEVAREMGAGPHLRLNKQASDDGARDSDHVLADIVESLLGAFYLEAGLDAAQGCVRRLWADRVNRGDVVSKHPKAALQEWAEANNRGLPRYAIVAQDGPDNARTHTIRVSVGADQQTATASTKREAESTAARALLTTLLQQSKKMTKKAKKPRTILPAARTSTAKSEAGA